MVSKDIQSLMKNIHIQLQTVQAVQLQTDLFDTYTYKNIGNVFIDLRNYHIQYYKKNGENLHLLVATYMTFK